MNYRITEFKLYNKLIFELAPVTIPFGNLTHCNLFSCDGMLKYRGRIFVVEKYNTIVIIPMTSINDYFVFQWSFSNIDRWACIFDFIIFSLMVNAEI